MTREQADRIERKLDKLLDILGHGPGMLQSEIKRKAVADVLQFQAKKNKKRGNECENKGRE